MVTKPFKHIRLVIFVQKLQKWTSKAKELFTWELHKQENLTLCLCDFWQDFEIPIWLLLFLGPSYLGNIVYIYISTSQTRYAQCEYYGVCILLQISAPTHLQCPLWLIVAMCKNTGKSSQASYFHFWHSEFNNTKSNFLYQHVFVCDILLWSTSEKQRKRSSHSLQYFIASCCISYCDVFWLLSKSIIRHIYIKYLQNECLHTTQ
jgi:hypothetical protein